MHPQRELAAALFSFCAEHETIATIRSVLAGLVASPMEGGREMSIHRCRQWSWTALFQLLFLVVIVYAVEDAPAQQDLELAHLSSLNLFTNRGLDTAGAQSLTLAVQQLNQLRGGTSAPALVVVTGSIGINEVLDEKLSKAVEDSLPAIPSPVQSSLDQSARKFALLLQKSQIPDWLFLPGRGDRIGTSAHELALYHYFLAKANQESDLLHGPNIIDLSLHPSFPAADVLILGLDTAGFVRQTPSDSTLEGFRTAFRQSAQHRVLVAVSWPRTGNPLPTHSTARPSNSQVVAWALKPAQAQPWLDVIENERVSAILSGDWQSADRGSYTDFHGLFEPDLSSADLTKLYVGPPLHPSKQNPMPEVVAVGFEVIRLDRLGRVSRVFYWSAPGGFELQPSSVFSRQLEIGDAYDRSGRGAEAADAYRKALLAADDSNRTVALHRLQGVLQSWGFYESWMQYRRSFVWLALVTCLILTVWWTWRGKRRLQIYPLDAPDEAKIAGAHLGQVGEYLVGLMRQQAAKAGPIGTTKLPFIWSGFSADLGSALKDLVPEQASGIVSWLSAWLFRAEFTLKGTIATSSSDAYIILTLSRRGTAIHSWERSTPLDGLHDTLKDLVYGVLLFVKGYAN